MISCWLKMQSQQKNILMPWKISPTLRQHVKELVNKIQCQIHDSRSAFDSFSPAAFVTQTHTCPQCHSAPRTLGASPEHDLHLGPVLVPMEASDTHSGLKQHTSIISQLWMSEVFGLSLTGLMSRWANVKVLARLVPSGISVRKIYSLPFFHF